MYRLMRKGLPYAYLLWAVVAVALLIAGFIREMLR